MLIPLSTDRPPRHAPVVTIALIAINVAAHLYGQLGAAAGWFKLDDFIDAGHFDPAYMGQWWRIVTSMFLHDPGSIWHILFNMVFLWVFGTAVEDRFTRFGFLGFYLIGGAVAALAHAMVDQAPVIGASGAISAVTGAYLILFPRSSVIVFSIFNMGMIRVSSLWLLGLYFCIDLLRQLGLFFGMSAGQVAYMAHLAGYVYGGSLAFVLLGTGVLPRQEYDAFFLFKQMRRRAALRAVNRGAPTGVWESASADTGQRLAAKKASAPVTPEEEREAAMRTQINRLAATDLPAAARAYLDLLKNSPNAVFAERRQLDLANQLMAMGEYEAAAGAYERLLQTYPGCDRTGEVRLMLGLVLGRHLSQPQRARPHLEAITTILSDEKHRALAGALLEETKT